MGEPMSRRPLGEAAMTVAERSRRKRARARALHEATRMSDVVAAPPEVIMSHDYPRMLYHPDGRTIVVDTSEQHEQLAPEGWVIAPLAVHRQRQVAAHGALGANPMAVMIREAIREVFDEYDLVPAPATGRLSSVGWRPAVKR